MNCESAMKGNTALTIQAVHIKNAIKEKKRLYLPARKSVKASDVNIVDH